MRTGNHFRVNTTQLFKELTENALAVNKNGIFKIPLNVFMNLLSQVAERAIIINDPILNAIMFDMALYELPSPASKEYGILMKKVYRAANKQEKKEKDIKLKNKQP